MDNRYSQRGVSAEKEDIHNAIKNLDKGLYPNAFCKIIPDILGGDPLYCNIMHADGAGTKSSLAYLYWKETGDMSVWEGVAQDAVVMNTDDLICVGATDNMLLSSTIGRNKSLIPGEVISALINGTEHFLEKLRKLGIGIYLTGGGALLRGIDKRLENKINIPFHVAEDPLHSVAQGTGIAIQKVDKYEFLMR